MLGQHAHCAEQPATAIEQRNDLEDVQGPGHVHSGNLLHSLRYPGEDLFRVVVKHSADAIPSGQTETVRRADSFRVRCPTDAVASLLVPSLPRLTIPDLVADPKLIARLVHEGETLYVERKERDPKDGLGATIASFANMLGGWLLIGVTDDRQIVGYKPPGRVDLQDYIRQLLVAQVDPLPPFAAVRLRVGRHKIGVVRVAESSDQPHITSEGVIYRRTPGGKERVTSASDIITMARRGEQARLEAEQVRLHLPLIESSLASPKSIFADGQRFRVEGDRPPPLLEWIVRASPYTMTGVFADRALAQTTAELAEATVRSLFPSPSEGAPRASANAEARARGVYCLGAMNNFHRQVDLIVDAGGTIAVRTAWRSRGATLTLDTLPDDVLCGLIRAAANMLATLDGYGRAAFTLEIRQAQELTMASGQHHRTINVNSLIKGTRLEMGGDLAIPAIDADISELADRWTRELARAAEIPLWEPAPEP
jgi:hypothetical protein